MYEFQRPLSILSDDDMQKIHHAALEVLDTVGMKIDHHEALDYLEAAGCKIDRESMVCKFPSDLVQKMVDKRREDSKNTDKIPECMAVRYSKVQFHEGERKVQRDFSVSTGGFTSFIYDLDGNRRSATIEDARKSIRMAHQMDNVTFIGLPCAAQDVPHRHRPIVMAAELVKNTNKFGGIEVFEASEIDYVVRIAEVVAGGKEALKKRPILVGYAEARTPLSIDNNMAEIYLEYLKRGFPQSLDTMPNVGFSTPMRPASALAMGVAETLGGLVLAYAVDENAVVGIDVTPSFSDMRTGIFKYAGAERIPLLIARVQMMADYYGYLAGIHGGKTDSCFPDVQAGVEKALSTMMPVLAGVIGIGTVGHLENAVTFSPLQLVIDNEITGYIRHALKGFEVSDETLCLDEIKQVGIGGSFINTVETATRFREEMFLSDMFEALPWETARSTGESPFMEKSIAKARELFDAEPQQILNIEQEKEIDEIVKEATSKIPAE
jgi:trimethylamine---corrinoid protein Co-methyltransferase